MFLFRNLFLVFATIALVEVALFIKVGEWLGIWGTVAAVLLTASIGVALIRREGIETIKRLQESLQQGRPPAVEAVEAGLLFFAAGLLLTPGFLTDIMGFMLVFRPTRLLFIGSRMEAIKKSFVTMSASQATSNFRYTERTTSTTRTSDSQTASQSGVVVEAEVVDSTIEPKKDGD